MEAHSKAAQELYTELEEEASLAFTDEFASLQGTFHVPLPELHLLSVMTQNDLSP